MIYLKQVKLLDPDLVAGDPEELKYPYKAPAVRAASPWRPAISPACWAPTGRENPPCWKR